MNNINEKGLSFGAALLFLNMGHRIARKNWNGKNQWVSLTPGKTLSLKVDNIWTPNVRKAAEENNGIIELLPYMSLKTAQNKLQIGWLPSQSDTLANDWFVYNGDKSD